MWVILCTFEATFFTAKNVLPSGFLAFLDVSHTHLHTCVKHGDLEGILKRGRPTVLPQANLQQPRPCSVSNDIGILLAGYARRWPPALWWDLPLICHGRWLLPAPRSHRAQFEPFQKPGPNPLLEIYLGSREKEGRAREPKVRRDTPRADEDGWVWSTPTIMASEKWGYLLSIPNEGNHHVYIVLFMAERGQRARECVCAGWLMWGWEYPLKDGEKKWKSFSRSPVLFPSILNECIVICFPSQTHLYFYWITPDTQPEPT